MSSRLPGQSWAPRIAGVPTGVVEPATAQRVLAVLGVLAVVLFGLVAVWTLGTETLVSGRQVAAVAALAVTVGALAVVVGFSVTTTE